VGWVDPLGLGLVTIDQVVPFHCSTNVLLIEPSKYWPDA
jgi:hypothetical protein